MSLIDDRHLPAVRRRVGALARRDETAAGLRVPLGGFEDRRIERISTLSFFLKYLKNPIQMGAVAPSGRGLTELIVSEIHRDRVPVLELGAGDGTFTAALLRKGVEPSQITVVEQDGAFAERLRQRFPTINIVHAAAEAALKLGGPVEDSFAAVVSGLPLLNFPWRTRQRLLRLIFRHMKAGGSLYQFTYGIGAPLCREMIEANGLEVACIGRVLRNIPPASVYRISKREASSS